MRYTLIRCWIIGMLGLLTMSALAQQETCPAIVQSVLDSADTVCESVGRNQVCYVNLQAEITPQDPTVRLKFDRPGDLVSLEYVESMIMTPLNTVDNTWGVSLMKLQANLPDTLPGQNVTMLLFGDVEIRNEVDSADTPITLPATATTNANVRVAPSTNTGVLRALTVNEAVTIDGRNSDGTWVRLALARGESGWVFADLLTIEGDIMTLSAVVAGEVNQTLTPMQAFYFKTGVGDAACSEAPESGIVIQTPSGGQKVNLTANGVDISLGSTAFLQAQPEESMTMAVVEGEGTLTASDVTVVVPAGSQSSVPLDEKGEPAGPPTTPEPYDEDKMNRLPITPLEEDIEIADSLTQEELDNFVIEPITSDFPVTVPNTGFDTNLWIPGLSAECLALLDKFVDAATVSDIDTLIALEAEFVGSGCEAEVQALADQYAGYDDEDYTEEDFDTGD